uniref:NodB homology domain-containing protein n=1 Tax=viral metagenome TaxID=1070528 RepID=A0A6C0CSX2_9ZZZZ
MTSILFFLIWCMIPRSVDSFTYNDQKQNCSKHVTGTFCYNGPQFDISGQYKSCSVPNTIALTFDDGPDNNIPYFLDTLKQFNMKGTFFLIGQNVQTYPALVQRIVDEGHQIGSHTYTHPWLKDLTTDQIRSEMLSFENAIIQHNYNGVLSNRKVPSYFRAPHGDLPSYAVPILQDFQLVSIQWGFLNGDTSITNSNEILPVWKSHLSNAVGSELTLIVQQHEIQYTTLTTFHDVLNYLNKTFPHVRYVSVAECLGNVVPPYHVSAYDQTDPTCANGIKTVQSGQNVCCSASCSTGTDGCVGTACCGGTGCGSRPGGSGKCCAGSIITANVPCMYSAPGCIYS